MPFGGLDDNFRFLTGSRNIVEIQAFRAYAMKICNLTLSYGRIAKISAQLSYGLVNSAMGQISCSTERISSSVYFILVIVFGSQHQCN